LHIFPNGRRPLPEADTKARNPVADLRTFGECAQKMHDQPGSRACKRMAESYGSSQRIKPFVIGKLQPELFHKYDTLDSESLVELYCPDIIHGESGSCQGLPGRGNGPVAHDFRLNTRIGVTLEAHAGDHPDFGGLIGAHQKNSRRTVIETRSIARRNFPLYPKRRLEVPEPFHARVRARLLVPVGNYPALPGIDGHWNYHLLNLALRISPGG